MEADTLVCLRIGDSGTEGLSGDNWEENGNFRRLYSEFSTGNDAGRGGLRPWQGGELDALTLNSSVLFAGEWSNGMG